MSRIICLFGLIWMTGCEVDETILVAVSGEHPQWVDVAVGDAVFFWGEKGGPDFIIVDEQDYNPDLSIYTVESIDNAMAVCKGKEIFLDRLEMDGLSRMYRQCAVAHEIGHYIGMAHVDGSFGPSLMSPSVAICDGECCWSDGDRAEFENYSLPYKE